MSAASRIHDFEIPEIRIEAKREIAEPIMVNAPTQQGRVALRVAQCKLPGNDLVLAKIDLIIEAEIGFQVIESPPAALYRYFAFQDWYGGFSANGHYTSGNTAQVGKQPFGKRFQQVPRSALLTVAFKASGLVFCWGV